MEVCTASFIAFNDAAVVSDDVRETTGEVVKSSDAIVELVRDCAVKVDAEVAELRDLSFDVV